MSNSDTASSNRPQILVVEDSSIERLVTTRLLAKANPEWLIRQAIDGVAGLEACAQATPDLILTDFQMPRMDGLEFIREVKTRYPSVPIVLMTAHGNETTASDALEAGAESYLPKRYLQRDLVNVSSRLLALSQQGAEQQLVENCLVREHSEFVLPTRIKLIPIVIKQLVSPGQRMGLYTPREVSRISVAFEECLLNAMIHGNLEVSSKLREFDDGRYEREIEKRLALSPYRERTVAISAEFTADSAIVTIRDQGPGFDVSALPDPTLPENMDRPHGRGLLLIRSFLDEVQHNATGNAITLTKYSAEARKLREQIAELQAAADQRNTGSVSSPALATVG